ncbi:hypothetical protein GYMLUDRAFT_262782, partial [Collybiopsis luxurians FD-317 M1]
MQTRSVNVSKLNQLIQDQLADMDRFKGTLVPLASKLVPRIVHRSMDSTGQTTESDLSDEPIGMVASLVLTHAASSPSFYMTYMKPIVDRFLENLTQRGLRRTVRRAEWIETFRQRELDELHLSSTEEPPSFQTLQSYLRTFTPSIVLKDNIEPKARGGVDRGDDRNEITVLTEAALDLNLVWKDEQLVLERVNDWSDHALHITFLIATSILNGLMHVFAKHVFQFQTSLISDEIDESGHQLELSIWGTTPFAVWDERQDEPGRFQRISYIVGRYNFVPRRYQKVDRRLVAKALETLRFDRLLCPLLIESESSDAPDFRFTLNMKSMRSDYVINSSDYFEFEKLTIESEELPPWNPNGPSGGGLVVLGEGIIGMSCGGDKYLCTCLGNKHKPTCRKF